MAAYWKHVIRLFAVILFALIIFLFSFFKADADSTIRIGFNCHLEPFQFMNSDGESIGMHIEMMNWICQTGGMNIEYKPYDSNSECIMALKNRDIDILLGYRMGESLPEGLSYVGELSAGSICLVVPKSLENNFQKRSDYGNYIASLEYGTVDYSTLSQMGFMGYKSYGHQDSLYDSLVNGKSKVIAAIEESITYRLKDNNLSDDYIILNRYVAPVRFSCLVRTDSPNYSSLISTGLTKLRSSGEYELIYRNWIVNDESYAASLVVRRVLLVAGIAGFVALIVIVQNVWTNALLKRKVAEKTAELEKKVNQLEEEYIFRNAIIENSLAGIVLFSKDYRINMLNPSARRILGNISEGEDIRNNAAAAAALNNSLVGCVPDVERNQSGQVSIGESPQKRNYRFSLVPSAGPDEDYLLTIEDVTTEERSKAAMFEMEKNRTLNQIVAGIAHEIKNPLMSIRAAASLMKERGSDPEVQEAFGTYVPNEVDRINRLVEGLINYAKPARSEFEAVDVSAIIRDCSYLMNSTAEKRKIHLKINADNQMFIWGQKDRVKQTIVNLLLNSIQSIEEKIQQGNDGMFEINIGCHSVDDIVSVTIHDEGCGMTRGQIDKCMEPFYTTKNDGNGLGLAVVKQCMESNNGEISIVSEVGVFTEIVLSFQKYESNI